MRKFIMVLLAMVTTAGFALDDIPLPLGGDFYGVGGDKVQTVNKILATGGVVDIGNGAATAVACSAVEVVPCVQKTVLTFSAINETFTDGSDEGESQLLYTFPDGRIYILGAAIDAAVTNNTGYEASANDVWLGGIGTAAAGDDATLAGTEQDVIASTTFDTASATVGHFDWEADMTCGADSVFDGTSAAVKLYFNAAAANTSISTNNATCGVQAGGKLTVFWIHLGDD
jgi:hypothetical protein